MRNVTRGTVIASAAHAARSAGARLLGLIGRDGAALILPDTPWIHTFFLAFPIDAVCYGRLSGGTGHVLAVVEGLRPWRVSPLCWRAAGVIELPG